MSFKIIPSTEPFRKAALIYQPSDYSFDTISAPDGNYTSVLINDLNLELNSAGKVISVWGLCPYMTWKETLLAPPQASYADIYFLTENLLLPAVSLRLNKDNSWPVLVDSSKGWVCIRNKISSDYVKVIQGVILGFDKNHNLSEIWLKPTKLPYH